MPKRYDLTVVGAGPAGMAAADRAVRGGLRVALVDAGAGLGGQYWRQPAPLSDASARSSVSFSASAKTGPYAGSGHQVTEDETASLHHRLSTFRRLRSRLLEAADHGTLDVPSLARLAPT
ncbi:MAG: FAD-dependent oxidoreductase, partial [Microlunatus sp.]|nr:FAD-dependent oxidoreductase [Microlunatus sp.]